MKMISVNRPDRIIGRVFTLLSCLFLLTSCGITYTPLPVPPEPQSREPGPEVTEPEKPAKPSAYQPSTGPAASLYTTAQTSMARGEFQKAELALERALRVEPRNGYYWYMMGDLKYRQGDNAGAIQFCLKSKSLAWHDKHLRRLNDELINKVRR